MITAITPNSLKEEAFQTIVKSYLITENDYVESFNSNYNTHYAIDTEMFFSFLEKTQKKSLDKLKEIYKTNYQEKILENLDRELASRGSIDVIKDGIKDYGEKLDLAYFKPPTRRNEDRYALYEQNIISVTEELAYEGGKRIDLVIFLNGIPIITMELKNSLTGQTYKNAISQYKKDRDKDEKIFRFKERSIVNFAIDTDEAYMTTRINGDDTYFLPFNKGNNGGAGNPSIKNKLATHYIWEEILEKDWLLEIIHKFNYVDKKETVIFPRYHQLDAVRDVLGHVKANGAGNKYLIQHSAGSGKTNSITWLSHRLASLHDYDNNVIFNGVIVVTDRTVLDKQLQDSIYQLEHKIGLVAKIEEGSSALMDEIEKGTKIIISTIQKFPHILENIAGTKDKRYAIIIDEAHSSTSGRNMMALKESLTKEEAIELASEDETEELDTADKINIELEKFVDNSNTSFFAFTATPKPTTLRLFGTQHDDGKYYPYHVYSMRQAIEEGFILDVLKNYMTYKMFYKVNKKVEDDPSFDKGQATRSIVNYVRMHPHNISQKTEIIVEHFKNHTMKKIGGKAKAMLVTSSRIQAVRYKLAIDDYIKRQDYRDFKTLVAFSGVVSDYPNKYKEKDLNDGISDNKLPPEFDKDDFRVLIVANKYQTGFDQPLLHTMYVDKKLTGVNAVQTLSRLNRIHPNKEDTFVIDFVNDPDEILESFKPFYQVAKLNKDIEPNEIYKIERSIYDKQVINKDDVIAFTDIFYKDKQSKTDTSTMNYLVNNSLNRTVDFEKEELIAFRDLLSQFISLYNLIIQVAPIVDTDLHRLSIYLRYLIKKIEIESTGGVDITDKVLLEYYKLEKQTDGQIYLEEGDGKDINIGGRGAVAEEDEDFLSNIIGKLNERYSTEFGESERLLIEQMSENLKKKKDLEQKAQNNTYDDFKYAFGPTFLDSAVEEYDKNTSFFGKILEDESFRTTIMDAMMFKIYEEFKERMSL